MKYSEKFMELMQKLIDIEIKFIGSHENNFIIKKLFKPVLFDKIRIRNCSDGDILRIHGQYYLATNSVREGYSGCVGSNWNDGSKFYCHVATDMKTEFYKCPYKYECMNRVIFINVRNLVSIELSNSEVGLFKCKLIKKEYGRYL